MKISKFALIAALATGSAQADITYIDAAEGSSGNTFATGGSLADTTWQQTGTDANSSAEWRKRSTFGNGGIIFEGDYAGSSDPELTTQITGLADGTYDVWVFFWDATGSNTWSISAGLTSNSLSLYSADGPGDTASPVNAGTLSFTATVLTVDSDRILYGVNLGQATVSGGSGLINVYVDGTSFNGATTPNGPDTRTWYDGVGYELTSATAPDPEITAISVSGNTATVVMTGAPGTDYYCAGSADLTGWTAEIVPTDTAGSPFQTDSNGDLTFTVDITGLGSRYFLRVQDTDPSP